MDDWLTNTAGAVPGDGAFERFLTAALAAIITLVFSWRLLGEVSETEREATLRRHAAARASGQYSASQLGISDEKLREVAEAFAKDRVKKLNSNNNDANVSADSNAVSNATDSVNASAEAEGSCVDTNSTATLQDPEGAEGGDTLNSELSQELTSEDRKFLEDLLKSSIDTSNITGSHALNSPVEGVRPAHALLPGEKCVSLESDIQQTSRFRLSEFPLDGTQVCSDSVTDTERSYSPIDYNTTTTPVDSDEEDDFQEYFGDTGNIHSRVFDSDDETFYRTFLEPIQEEMSGEDPLSSSDDEWDECGAEASDESPDSRSTTPQPVENNITESVGDKSNSQEIQETEIDVKTIAEKLSESDNSASRNLGDERRVSDGSHKGVSDCFVFDAYQTSQEETVAENGADDPEVADDSVSEESDDTVIMVFSSLRNREENGTKQSQNEIVYLDQERYDGYRDMFLTEKFEEMDSDDDIIIPPSKHYDQIRNNLTLIGSDDGDNISPDYDEYERGSWSDPDDNFRCSIPRWNRYGGFVADDFVKPNNNDNPFSYDDQSFSWKSVNRKEQNSFKPDVDFEFEHNMPRGYDDAPFSSAAEAAPVGFTFVEVKDSFTEFSLRNYVRDKDNFDPKLDSGIFTDNEEFTLANNGSKLSEDDRSKSTDVIPEGPSEFQDDNNSSAYSDNNLEQPESNAASVIDSENVCNDQYISAVPDVATDNFLSTATVSLDQSSLNRTNDVNNDIPASRLSTGDESIPLINSDITDDVSSPQGTSDILLNKEKSEMFDKASPDPDSFIDEVFSFHHDISDSCVDIDEGSGESVPVLPNSCQLNELKQTEISCWSSHTQDLPHNSVYFNSNTVFKPEGEAEGELPAHKTTQIKREHCELIRPSSPVSSPEYYTKRKRRSHNEAVLLDQLIAPDSELSSEEEKENDSDSVLQRRDKFYVSAKPPVYSDYQKLESSVDPLPCELLSSDNNTSSATPGRQTDIDSVPLAASDSDNRTNRFRDTTDSGIALEETATPGSVDHPQQGVESVRMRTKPGNKQVGETESLDDNTVPQTPDNSSNRLSITLEESPVICLQPDAANDEALDGLTCSSTNLEQSSVINWEPNTTTKDASEQDTPLSSTSLLEESPVICLKPGATAGNQEHNVSLEIASTCHEEELLVIKTDNTKDTLEETTSTSNKSSIEESPVIYLKPDTPTDAKDDNVFEEPASSSSPRSSLSPELPAVLDRGSRVTLPRRYTPSADYRKLLKPTTPRRYNSVLQRPISSDKLHVNYTLPQKPVPKIRRKILASRQRFLSEDNLCSPNDSFEDAFSDHSAIERYHPQSARRSVSPTNRQSYSVADISRLYASTLSSPRKPRPDIDQLHENCILSPERLALLRSRAFSTDSIGPQRRVSRQPSVSSLVETNLDTGETSETPQFTETDLDVPFGLQNPVEKTVSMMDLRSGRSRFAARKKAAEERKKCKSLQQLGTNVGSLETDIDAPFPDGSGITRVPSEHELRVTRSLSKLNVPDWLRRSTVYRTGSHFILRRDSNASSISQWSSKSYGPLATTRDSSRASSCVTLSQPSPVVIRTRVSPSSTGKLMGSPTIGSSTKHQSESRPVKLPSAKFREREKPSGLKPILIVPFEQLRAKFENKEVNGTSAERQPVRAVETKIIVEPIKNPPPGILKQTQPMASTGVNYKESESVTIDRNKANKSPPMLQVRLPPPKITVTTEKSVSPKDKTSPSAFEKSVRFSPILNRMDLSSGPSVMPPSPEADFQPVNGGTVGKKPNLPPKPAKRLLQWKSSPPINEEPPAKPDRAVPKPEKAVPKPEKPAPKPAPSEKPSRIANLIRRFKETTV